MAFSSICGFNVRSDCNFSSKNYMQNYKKSVLCLTYLLVCLFDTRLLPKKIFREPFGLPKLEIGSPRYISRSPRLFSQIQTMSYETYSLDWKGVVPRGEGGGLEYKKGGDACREF